VEKALMAAATGPNPVKPDRILKELADLWTSTAKSESPEDREGHGVLRACSMTLIVFVDDEDDSMALGETIAELMREHPSRAIVVRISGKTGVLESRVFAQCWMPFGHHRQICCEEVEITVSLDHLSDTASLVAPLAAADLPRVVWFRSARLAGAADISGILGLGDKLIVDSARPGAPAFADLRSLCTAGFVTGDLAWTRITTLRELIARLLENRDLAAITRAAIEHCGKGPGPEARYLQAWLRSCLSNAAIDFSSTGEGVGSPKGLRVDPDIYIQIEAGCAQYESGGVRQRANLFSGSDSELLTEELKIMKHDPVFEQALRRMTIWIPKS
jgi:glucose-6-phosphate dehydrogenase assembly protein OpcA